MKVLELFAGIGACSKALERLGVEHEIVDAVEIDKYAIASFNAIHNTNFEPQDITKWDKNIEVDLVMHGSPCFIAGTKILTDKGYKNIEDIKVGDMVLTHKNRYQKVTVIGNKQAEIFRVKAQGSIETFVTGNHPYYVRTKSKKWNNEERKYERIFSKPEWKEVKDLTTNDFVGINIPLAEENKHELDKETCWLLGRYVADGHIRHDRRKERVNSYQYGVVYSIGENKIDEFRSRLKKYKPTIVPHTKSCIRAVINSQKLVEFIESENFGKEAINKDIPMFVLNLPKDLAEEFLNGYMSGDGCFTNGGYKASSISQNLIMKLQLLIAKIYGTSSNINFTKRPEKHTIEGRIVNQNPSWSIAFQKEIKKQNKSFVDSANNIIWYPIKELKKLNTIDTVYNITVEGDHSYTANNLIVHNCQDFSVAGKQAGGDIGSGTRSSLMYETIRIIGKIRPKYVIWENVKNLLSQKHRHNFDAYLDTMKALGYTNYYQVLNAKDYGIPQNRERVFTISIRQDICKSFVFPVPQELKLRLKDMLDDEVDDKYYLSDVQVERMKTTNFECNKFEHKVTDENGITPTLCARDYKDPKCVRIGGVFDTDTQKHQAGSVWDTEGLSPTLDTMQGGYRMPLVTEGKVEWKEFLNSGYFVSNTGLVKGKNGKLKSQREDKDGYLRTNLTINGKEKDYKIATLVATLFVENPLNKETVNHKDGNKKNNHYTNLEWLTVLENLEHRNKILRHSGNKPNQLRGVHWNEEKNKWEAQMKINNKSTYLGRFDTQEEAFECYRQKFIELNGYEPWGLEEKELNLALQPTIIASRGRYKKDGTTEQHFEVQESGLTNTITTVQKDNYLNHGTVTTTNAGYRIRKLTPKECWRLMGFDDEDFDKASKVNSNSQLYKQAGNSICVPVLEGILKKILE